MTHTCCDTILTVLLAPLGYFCKTKECCTSNFLVILLLSIFTADIFGGIYAFYCYGMDICVALLCFFLPPLGVLFGHGGCFEIIICCVLTLLGVLPGIIYAFHVCMEKVEKT